MNLPANAGGASSIPGSGRSPVEGNGNPLLYSCLENPTNGGAWLTTVHRVAKNWTQLKQLSTHAQFCWGLCTGRLYILPHIEVFTPSLLLSPPDWKAVQQTRYGVGGQKTWIRILPLCLLAEGP